jgi:Holliday junction resolvase RusA-like endonuclease
MSVAAPDFTDPPFLAPIETSIDLPVPPSINDVLRNHGKGTRIKQAWIQNADMHVMARGGLRKLAKMPGKFEVTLVLAEDLCGCDLDNCVKLAIDYARRLRLIINDDKRYMRGVHIVWGEAPAGCRLILRSVAP